MGIFDIFGPSQEELDSNYALGVDAAKNADLLDDIIHEFGHVIGTIVPSSPEHRAYEAGYHDQTRGEAYKK